jgi:hypothetical protein
MLVGHAKQHSWLIGLLAVADVMLLAAVLRIMQKHQEAAIGIQRKLVQLRKRLDDLPGDARDKA